MELIHLVILMFVVAGGTALMLGIPLRRELDDMKIEIDKLKQTIKGYRDKETL